MGLEGRRTPFAKSLVARLGPSVRLRLALAAAALVGVATLATCGGCGKRAPASGGTPAAASASAVEAKASPERDARRTSSAWTNARAGELEDVTALANEEGAAGLVEAAADPELRPTAIEAMGVAWGWAQLPFLARAAAGKDDGEARAALEAAVELAARPRRAEDPEDADELREGCAGLLAIARDRARLRERRVLAVRALRMMPCPPVDDGGDGGAGLPSDVDAK